jgi:hypothetical protein
MELTTMSPFKKTTLSIFKLYFPDGTNNQTAYWRWSRLEFGCTAGEGGYIIFT